MKLYITAGSPHPRIAGDGDEEDTLERSALRRLPTAPFCG
jgi:hypothetical protein